MKWMNLKSSRARTKGRKLAAKLAFDVFEERVLLATFPVTTTTDNGNNTTPTPGSLRAAILNANTAGGADTITFNIPGSGVQTLAPTVALPTILGTVILDATTQPGYAGAPLIALNGGSVASADGLTLGVGSGGSTIKGLNIFNFAQAGILVQTANNIIQSNYLGTDAAGSAAGPGNGIGVFVDNVSGNTIGGTGAGEGNIIGFNATGVSISGAAATGNLVLGNFLGTNSGLTASLGNTDAIVINGAPNNTIGGSVTNAPNAIAFNTGIGIQVTGATAIGNLITQNSIFRNTGLGIDLATGGNGGQAAPVIKTVNTLGGTTNVTIVTTGLAPNSIVEVFSGGAADPLTGNQARTFVGSHTVTAGEITAGTATFPTATSVPLGRPVTATITPTTNNTSEFAANVISVNPFLVTTTADNGSNANPTPGSLRAAIINANASTNPIGDIDTITFNIQEAPVNGVWTLNLVSNPLPAITEAVVIDATAGNFYQGSPAIVINGGSLTGDGLDLAAGSGGSRIRGLAIVSFQSGAGIHIASAGNSIQSNYLGANAAGTAAGPGNRFGILIDGAGAGNTIGGLATVGNLISGNTTAGVSISGTSAGSNVIQGNLIGTAATGMSALANAAGILIDGSSNNTVGGTATNRGNIIAFNAGAAVTVENAGVGNVIRLNSIFRNGSGIILATGGNAGVQTPVLSNVNSVGSTTTVQVQTSSYTAGSILDFYSSSSGDPTNIQGQAHNYLGSYTLTGADVIAGTITVTLLNAPVGIGQTVTATVTSAPTANNTSQFANAATVVSPFVVTTIDDNGSDVSPTPGSLRAAIINANNSPGLDAISFAITTGGPTFTFAVSTALPMITDPVVIDGTSQTGYTGTPILVLNGVGNSFDGLILGTGSGGSTIRGLSIVNFAGAGIRVSTDNNAIVSNYLGLTPDGTTSGNTQGIVVTGSNNSIGGAATGIGNTITANTSAGVLVDTGTGNAIRGNSIYNQPSPISLTNGGNGDQAPPTIDSVTSSSGKTTVQVTLTTADGFTPGTTYTIDLYASAPGDLTEIQAQIYLGSFPVTTALSGDTTFTGFVSASVTPNQKVTATATSPSSNTSTLAAPKQALNPFIVTTVADNGNDSTPTPGSLRAAILAANTTPGLDTIVFAITSGSHTIIVSTITLPTITDPVIIDGTTQSDFATSPIIIDGNGGTFAALTLGAGSGGSTIAGLQITNFNGGGIVVNSANNLIGGTATGTGNVIHDITGTAINVTSGTGNQIRQNLIYSVGGGIVVPASAPDTVTGLAYTSVSGGAGNLTTIDGSLSGPSGTYVVEFFASAAVGGPAAIYLGSVTITIDATLSVAFTSTFSLPATLTSTQNLTATVTSLATGSTSTFATAAAFSDPFTVSNSASGTDGDFVGTLRSAITNVNFQASVTAQLIGFTIADGSTITLGNQLPTITSPVTIDGVGKGITIARGGPTAFDGLVLDTGSGGSAIRGLTLSGFANAIVVKTSDNSIGGTTTGHGNTIFGNSNAGITVLSGDNNLIRANSTFNNGPGASLANNIVLIPGANKFPSTFSSAPIVQIVGAQISDTNELTLQFSFTFSSEILSTITIAAYIDVFDQTGELYYGSFLTSDLYTYDPQNPSNTIVTKPYTFQPNSNFSSASPNVSSTASFVENTTQNTSAFSNSITPTEGQFVVTTTADNSNVSILGSLRQVIEAANKVQSPDLVHITFAIRDASSPIVINIAGAKPLPVITHKVWIDGLSQDETGQTKSPIVNIAGTTGLAYGLKLGTETIKDNLGNDLVLTSNGSTISGLAIYGFSDGSGILVESDGNAIINNYVGFDSVKTITGSGNQYGIDVTGLDNTIGGLLPTDQNQISANLSAGIRLGGDGSSTVLNNLIGSSVFFDPNTANQTGNGGAGILVNSSNNTIGAVLAQDGMTVLAFGPNKIDGNKTYGINIAGGSSNFVLGNTIGQAQSYDPINGWSFDQLTYGNGKSGINILNSASNKIGHSNIYDQVADTAYYVRRNDGTYEIASYTIPADTTLYQEDGSGNYVEITNSTVPLDGNLIYYKIADDTYAPIVIEYTPDIPLYQKSGEEYSLAVTPVSNMIFGNGGDGISIEFTLPINASTVSISNAIENNQISNNGGNGISFKFNPILPSSAGGTVSGALDITGNRIGTNPQGDSTYELNSSIGNSTFVSVGNGKDGIYIQSIPNTYGATIDYNASVMISDNVISGNGISGIDLDGSPFTDGTSVPTVYVTANRIGTNLLGTSAFDSRGNRMGNVLDGILLNEVIGARIGEKADGGVSGNIISGNLGRGIEIRGDATKRRVGAGNTIRGNFIGTGVAGLTVTDAINAAQTLGNLGDGIFIIDVNPNEGASSSGDRFIDNVISGNRGYGIHVKSSSKLTQITGNFIGTSAGSKKAYDVLADGTRGQSYANNADGIFFDEVYDSTIGGTNSGAANVISNNSANGINLLQSSNVSILGNLIGTDVSGTEQGFGNSGNGIFLNQSGSKLVNKVPKAGNTVSGNTVSGNAASGIIISGSGDGSNASNNQITDNLIGLGADGKPLPNAVSGVVISGAKSNTVSQNTISGNRLYGVQLAAGATGNTVGGNYIGTDASGNTGLGNTSDGVFIINSPSNIIGGNDEGSGNVISGNFANGVRIFGEDSTTNLIAGNLIGLGVDSSKPLVPNLGNGVLFDNVGSGNRIGDGSTAGRNVISGNIQSGILIVDNKIPRGTGLGTLIQGNYIGTNRDGNDDIGNGANGILLFGSSYNTIGGTTDTTRNVISGNLQSGVFLYSAAQDAQANNNLIVGNWIGTDATGSSGIANNADGIQIVNGNNNYIAANLLSGNLAAGINITAISDSADGSRLTASGNIIDGNLIGTKANGLSRLDGPQQSNGVVIQDATNNLIGASLAANVIEGTNVPPAQSRSNVISGNRYAGILLNGASQGNIIQRNYIGVGANGSKVDGLGNGGVGVFINNTAGQPGNNVVGGTYQGAGNLIAGNATVGIQIFGPTNGTDAKNSVLGNLIGLSLVGNGPNPGFDGASNFYGILIQESSGNSIGAAVDHARNVISGNENSGVFITGNSSRNVVLGNYIGTNPAGRAEVPGQGQRYGVQISGNAFNNVIGNAGSFTDPWANVVSGNATGIAVNDVPGSPTTRNLIQGNLVGVTPDGLSAAPNSEYGIFINNSPNTLVQSNLASANEIAGIGIFDNGSTNVTVVNNYVGTDIAGRPSLQGPTERTRGSQLYGVVIIGASNNTVGTGGAGNLISGNSSVGVYISRQDFFGKTYSIPTGNRVQGNTITQNRQYGILFYNAPNNIAPPFTGSGRRAAVRRKRAGSNTNVVFGNGVNFLNFITRVNRGNGVRKSPKARPKAVVNHHAHPKMTPDAQAKPLRVIMPKHK